MSTVRIGQRTVSPDSEPYVIAEVGVNHEGSLAKARELIELAAQGGAHAVKFQTYKAAKLASRHSPAYWDLSQEPTRSQFELFQKYDSFGQEEYRQLAEHCRRHGVEFMSTPFDLEAVDFLDPLMSCFKIASADITNLPLLRKVAAKNKPVLLSTGASTLKEVALAVGELRQAGCGSLALLHCVLNYPTEPQNAFLGRIAQLGEEFGDCLIGYSDHTRPDPCMLVLLTAYLKGARILEKHFTDDKSLPGNDHYHAMDAGDLRNFFARLDLVRQIEAVSGEEFSPSEQIARENARRSIVLNKALAAGQALTPEVLICKRPGLGISPLHWDEVLGRRLRLGLPEDHILQWDDLE